METDLEETDLKGIQPNYRIVFKIIQYLYLPARFTDSNRLPFITIRPTTLPTPSTQLNLT